MQTERSPNGISTSYDLDYYAARVERVSGHVKEERDFYLRKGYAAAPDIWEYIEYLSERIGQGVNWESVLKRQQDIVHVDPDQYVNQSINQAKSKPFNKLAHYHKVQALRQYAEELPYTIESASRIARNKKAISEQLLEGLKEKRFNSGGTKVLYDQKEGKIIDIPSVIEDEDRPGRYKIDWSRKHSSAD